jgi:glycine cleavage system H protein
LQLDRGEDQLHGNLQLLAYGHSQLPVQVKTYDLLPRAEHDVNGYIAQVKKYTTDHEWVELSEDGKTGFIGISDYAAHALGDVVYVELPTTPMEVSKGDAIGAVESVKSASDINSPISCTITSVNDLLEEKPGSINKGPEDDGAGGGWVAKVEVSGYGLNFLVLIAQESWRIPNRSSTDSETSLQVGEAGVKDLEDLMDAAAYKKFTEDA